MSILAPSDAEMLLASGLATLPSPSGFRRIHKRRLNCFSDVEYGHIPLNPVTADSTPDTFSTIPDMMVSLATVQYLGYNEATAKQLWDKWTNWPQGGPVQRETDVDSGNSLTVCFIDFLTGHLLRDDGGPDEDDQTWIDYMERAGIDAELQGAIMDPVFRNVRLTQSCYFWVKDTIRMRHRGLQEIQRASRERAKSAHRFHSRPGASSAAPLSATTSGFTGDQRSVSGTLRMAPGISRDTAMSPASLLAAENAPGSVVLFKGLDQARVVQAMNDKGELTDLGPLFSPPPTDFCRREMGLYFTPHRDIAVRFACYAKQRDHVSSVVLLQVALPNSAIESLSEAQLQKLYWPSADWKRIIFYCRRFKKLPTDLGKVAKACVVIGTIAKRPNKFFVNMDSPDQIVEADIFKTEEGRHGVQYVFRHDEGENLFEEHAMPTAKVFPLTGQEYSEWHEARE